MVYDAYMAVVPFATALGFIAYIIIGFILSKMFKHGKIGNWF
jgi:sulfoxide reductase heme-binding subunit YedZ